MYSLVRTIDTYYCKNKEVKVRNMKSKETTRYNLTLEVMLELILTTINRRN